MKPATVRAKESEMTEIDLKARVLALEWALKDLLRHHDAAYAMTAPGIPCGCLRMLAHASVRRAREVLGDSCIAAAFLLWSARSASGRSMTTVPRNSESETIDNARATDRAPVTRLGVVTPRQTLPM